MTAYFPLLPTVSMESNYPKISASLTFLNFPNNRLNDNFFKKKYNKVVYLGVYSLGEKYWILLNVYKCNPEEFVEISRNDLNVNDNEIIVVVPKEINNFLNETLNLPKPDALRLDNSPVAQRTSLNFSYENCISSYQGEYPYSMASIKKGSFFSFDTLKERKNEKVKNFIILVNISLSSNSRDLIKVKIFSPQNKEDYLLIDAKRNAYTILDIDSYQGNFENQETLFLSCNLCTFIPIVLSVDLVNKQLSLEHTHPPSELFFGDDKFKFVNLIKKQWL